MVGKQSYVLMVFLSYLIYNWGKGWFTCTKPMLPSEKTMMCSLDDCRFEFADKGRAYYNENVDIMGCFFIRIFAYSYAGGVICIDYEKVTFNITSSTFVNCSSSQNGGAIYCNLYLSSYLKKICAYSCLCGPFNYGHRVGHFASILALQNNYLEHGSISTCSYMMRGVFAFHMSEGNQSVSNTNCSMNRSIRKSGINLMNSKLSRCSFCTFSNNNVTEYGLIDLRYSTGQMMRVNIIHNMNPNNHYILSSYESRVKLFDCVFDMNQGCLFYVDSSLLEVSNCFIYHLGNITNSRTITLINNSFTKMATHQFQFYKSNFCHADNPLPDQTPLVTLCISMTFFQTLNESPVVTPQNTPKSSPKITLIETLKKTQKETVKNTQNQTPLITPERTLVNTQMRTPERTIVDTLNQTPMGTHERTIVDTPNPSPLMTTIEKTVLESISETLMNSFEQINEVESTQVFLLMTNGIIIIILSIVFGFLIIYFYQKNQMKDDSSSLKSESFNKPSLNNELEMRTTTIAAVVNNTGNIQYYAPDRVFL